MRKIETIEVILPKEKELVELSTGLKGETGVSITDFVLNEDGTATTTFDNGEKRKAKLTSFVKVKEEADKAQNSAEAAYTSMVAAQDSERKASVSEVNAKASEQASKLSETNAKKSEESAASSAATATGQASSARTSASNASVSEANAKASEKAASVSASNAKASASNAAISASNSASSASASEVSNQNSKKWAEYTESPDGAADTDSTTGKTQSSRSWALYSKAKAQESASSASTATAQANTATTQANNAKTSATNSANSASASATSASNAKTSETNAGSNATTSRNWAVSETSPDGATDTDSGTGKTQSSRTWALESKANAQSASSSASIATSQASSASTSAANASKSATSASSSATNAASSATSASDSASLAASSAASASDSKDKASEYKTSASGSATAAASSASSASTSATNARAAMNTANTAASSASTSATSASTSASNASKSEVAAKSAQAEAERARDEANSALAKISGALKYMGQVDNYNDLPSTGNSKGDTWNVVNADPSHHIKAGDNVAWNGTEWDDLSGVVDLSAYAEKADYQKAITSATANGATITFNHKDGTASTATVNNVASATAATNDAKGQKIDATYEKIADASNVHASLQDSINTKLDKTGTAVSATKLQTPRTISLTGKASGSTTFDGSANASINVTSVNADSATKIINNGNRNNIEDGVKPPSGLSVYQCYTGTGYPQQYGNVVSIGGLGDNELFLGWQNDARLLFRAKRDTWNNWMNWRAIAFTDEINNYAPTKTGGGASGTWGISITGNAATANTLKSSSATETSTAARPVWLSREGDNTKQTVSPNLTYTCSTKTLKAENFAGHLAGNADMASKLQTARTISLTGNASGSVTFDGTSDINISTTVNESKHAVNADVAKVIFGFSEIDSGNWGHSTGTFIAGFHEKGGGAIQWRAEGGSLYEKIDGTFWQREGMYEVIDTSTVNNYAPTKTGTGASGTWGINITGTATKATKDASGNVIADTYAKKKYVDERIAALKDAINDLKKGATTTNG